ncbi:putative hydrolase [Gordonia effusa NBRC 100432]|uniref:Putative hydrolase n=1 Tax=Gordonia effusa NBRC 100432 TaxID=1077974 RepID=H0QWQ3_9ACTN|nr:MBL fold metallo-hydrolase [Gordonia effusa]GAB17254.1 putative hydrolase [Gordonia effusa NBRC 100432]
MSVEHVAAIQIAVGNSTITGIYEQPLGDINMLIDASADQVRQIDWLAPHYATAEGELVGNIQSFLVHHEGTTILVDTCVGNDKEVTVVEGWNNLHSPYPERLREQVTPDKVDYVLCTHLHVDHVGWQTRWDGTNWQVMFPNARHIFSRREFDHWRALLDDPTQLDRDPSNHRDALLQSFEHTQRRVFTQSIQPVVDAELVDLVDPPYDVVPGVRMLPTPGHTPGHISVEIVSEGRRAIVTGDMFHHPYQLARPDNVAVPDSDSVQALASRRALLTELVGTDTLLVGTHFAEPWAGVVVADGDTYRFEAPS